MPSCRRSPWRCSRVDGVAAPTDVLVRGRNKHIRTRHDQAQDVRFAHPRPLLETICSSKSARANLVQRHTHTNDGFLPRRAQYCSPSPRGREHLAPLDCRRRAVRVQRRHSDRLGRQLLPALADLATSRVGTHPPVTAAARPGSRARRVVQPLQAEAVCQAWPAGNAISVSLRRSSFYVTDASRTKYEAVSSSTWGHKLSPKLCLVSYRR